MRVAGVDLARTFDRTAIVILEGERVIATIRLPTGLEWADIAERVAAAIKGCQLAAVDSTGVGDAFLSLLSSETPIEPVRFTAQSKKALVMGLIEAIQGRTVSIDPQAPGADDLLEELRRFAATPSGRGWRFSGKADGTDDCAIAMALAVHARNLIHKGVKNGEKYQ